MTNHRDSSTPEFSATVSYDLQRDCIPSLCCFNDVAAKTC
jgi:hypothetical protein